MAIDYSKGEEIKPATKDELEVCVELAREQYRLEQEIEKQKKYLQDLSAQYLTMRTETLPSKMKELGLTELALDNGAKIVIKDDIYPHITEEHKPGAYGWMREHGHGDIIKNEMKISFGMGQDDDKQAAVEFAELQGYDYGVKESIHPGTLKAWVKEQLENGDDPLPENLITVHRVDTSYINLPKKKKGRKKA